MPKILCIPLYVPNAIQMPCSSHILLRSRIFLRASSSQARLKATHGALGNFEANPSCKSLGFWFGVRCLSPVLERVVHFGYPGRTGSDCPRKKIEA